MRLAAGGTGRGGQALVLTAILVFALSLRAAVTSLTPLLGRISTDLEFGNAAVGVIGMLPTLMFGIAGLVGSGLGRRFGLEAATVGAVIVTAVGTGLRGVATDTWSLIALSAVALFGMGLGNVLIPPLVKRYFPHRIAASSTAYILCVQLGTSVPAALAVPAADAAGWRWALAAWALIPLLALLPWIEVARRRRAAIAEEPDQTAVDRLPVWRSPIAWGLVFMFGMTSLMTYSLLTWIPAVLADAGGDDSLGGAAVAVFAGVGFLATFVAPWLCLRFANPFGFIVVFGACMLGGLAGLYWAPLSGTMAWVLLAGLGVSSFPMSLTLINVRTRTAAGSSSLSGFGQGLGYLIACAGPILFGVLRDASGGWGLPLSMLAVATAVMLAGGFVVCRPRFLEDSLSPAP
ncbi:MFS transporter [Gordonia phosphorivorans]|uniref:MFS transporter n=1 Tax=Gordonia phosphorivorans TaxID=1056982 RepID=A0ABV6H341_9ACTN